MRTTWDYDVQLDEIKTMQSGRPVRLIVTVHEKRIDTWTEGDALVTKEHLARVVASSSVNLSEEQE